MAKPFTKPKLNEAIWATSQVVKPPQETTSKTGPASRNEVVRDIEAGDRGYTGMILLMAEILHHLGCMKP